MFVPSVTALVVTVDRLEIPTSPAAALSCRCQCWSSTRCLTVARKGEREGLGHGGENQPGDQPGRQAQEGPRCQS